MADSRTPIFVEYHSGRPFDVLTDDGHSYDFEYCRRDGLVYYNMSGCGLTAKAIGAPRFCEPKKTVRSVRIWVAPGLRLVDERGRTVRKHEVRGYRLLERLPGNPFDRPDVCEGSTIYCRTCKDYLPDDTDRPCAHVWWCDACSSWAGDVDSPCEHETREASREAFDAE